MSPTHVAVLGPTCSWKSAVAVILAEALHGEVVSCDSMLVYRGLDIGTAKPTPAERRGVPHHLCDVLAPAQACDAALYVRLAQDCLADIEGRGRTAVLAGGTGLYARALLYGQALLPADDDLAKAILARLAEPDGLAALRAELSDAAHASGTMVPSATIQNPRRLARAVEVLRLTGRLPWSLHGTPAPGPVRRFRQIILLPEMAVLRPRIARRTLGLLNSGWIEETRQLVAQGLLDTPSARQALGYADIAAFLRGEITSVTDLVDVITRRTIRFARRQRTWFRHQHPGARTLVIRRETTAEEVADVVLHDLREGQWAPDGTAIGPDLVLE